ncbi:hypothetical protein J6590_003398 [Homalodisca vitripennis]|nr:hypothetical protein J6590_003398 [Homalodisca vitripennis]
MSLSAGICLTELLLLITEILFSTYVLLGTYTLLGTHMLLSTYMLHSTYMLLGPHTPASLAREPGSTRLEMDQIRQCMDNKEPSRVKFRRAEPDPPLLAVRLGSARLEYQFASVWRITDRTRAPTTEKSVHSVFTTVGQTLRTTRSAKVATFFEKLMFCNWASKIRRCMVNNQRVRLAS